MTPAGIRILKIVDGRPQTLARVHALVDGTWAGKVAGAPDWLSFAGEREALEWLKTTSLGILSTRERTKEVAHGMSS